MICSPRLTRLVPATSVTFTCTGMLAGLKHKSCTAESRGMLPCRGAQAADWETYKQAASTWEEGQAQKELCSNAAQGPHVDGHVVRMPQQNLHIIHRASVKQMLCPPSIWRLCLTACSHAEDLYVQVSFVRAACIPDTSSLMDVMGCRIRISRQQAQLAVQTAHSCSIRKTV